MTSIVRIEISHHRLPLDPPFIASWDPRPGPTSRPRSCKSTTTPATSGSDRATRCTGSPTTSRTSSARTRSTRSTRWRPRQHRVPRRPTVATRRRPVGPRRQTRRPAGLGSARRSRSRVRAYASSAVHRPAPTWWRWRDERSSSASPPSRCASDGPTRRRPGDRQGDSRRRRRGVGADGRLQPGLADALGRAPAVGRRPATAVAERWPPTGSTGSRNRCTAGTTTGWPSCAGGSTSRRRWRADA